MLEKRKYVIIQVASMIIAIRNMNIKVGNNTNNCVKIQHLALRMGASPAQMRILRMGK